MVKVTQGDVYWYDFAEPRGSEPGYEHPVVVVQGDPLNRTTIDTTVIVVLTSNLRLASAMGNVFLPKKDTGLERDTVANISQLQTVDRNFLRDQSGRLSRPRVEALLRGIDIMLGR